MNLHVFSALQTLVVRLCACLSDRIQAFSAHCAHLFPFLPVLFQRFSNSCADRLRFFRASTPGILTSKPQLVLCLVAVAVLLVVVGCFSVSDDSSPVHRKTALSPTALHVRSAKPAGHDALLPASEFLQRSESAGMVLPYAESPDASMEDSVRQVDHALLQTMLRLELSVNDVRIEHVETRHTRPIPSTTSAAPPRPSEPYHFQRLRVFSASDEPASQLIVSSDFLQNLEQSLRTWAENSRLERVGADCARIRINSMVTHELAFGTASFCPPDAPSLAGKPQLALVIDDMGMSVAAAETLLALKIPLSFAIWPHAPHARDCAERAYRQKREVLIHQPMEPLQYPYVKPGPQALYVRMNSAEIATVVQKNIALVPYATGINNHMGSRFTSNPQAVAAFCAALQDKGLFVLDSLTAGSSVLYQGAKKHGLRAYERTLFLDNNKSVAAVRTQLEKAESLALQNGQVVVIGHPYPATIKALQEWAQNRNAAVHLVSVGELGL